MNDKPIVVAQAVAAADTVATTVFDYSYSLLYKLHETLPDTLSDLSTMEVLRADFSFKKVDNFSQYYDGIADSIDLECDTKYKCIEIAIKRNAKTFDDGTETTESVLVHELKDLYTHQYKYIYKFNETVIINSATTNYKFIACVRTFYHNEYAPCHYYIDRIEFDNTPNNIQHIDFVITDANESVKNTNGNIETVGNTILYQKNVSVNKLGQFIVSDTDKTLKRFTIADGIFDYDARYNLYVYHHEQDEVYVKQGYTPQIIHVGDNPIWDKIIFQDGNYELYTGDVDILAGASPSADQVKWFFDLGNSTHGIGASGGIAYPVPDEQVKDFHFVNKASADAEEESYNCMEINKDNYIRLPREYTKDNFDDLGFSSNVWIEDIFGNIDFSKLAYDEKGNVKKDSNGNYIDRYGTILTEGEYTYRVFFMKFYVPTQDNTSVDLLTFKYHNGTRTITLDLSNINNVIINYVNPADNTKQPLIEFTDFKYNKWFTLMMFVKHGIIEYINVNSKENYQTTSIPINKGFGNTPGEEHLEGGQTAVKRISCDKTVTMTVTYNATGNNDEEIAIVPVCTSYQYADNDNLIGIPNTEYLSSPIYLGGTNGADVTKSVTFEHGGYGIIPGFKIINTKGGSTNDKNINIKSIKFGGTTYNSNKDIGIIDNIDAGVSELFKNTSTGDYLWSTIIVAKTANSLGNPIGGTWNTPNIDCSELVDTTLGKDNFKESVQSIQINSQNTDRADLYVCKVGLHIAYMKSAFNPASPYDCIPSALMDIVGGGYKYNTKVEIECSNGQTVDIIKFKELKNGKVWFMLPADISVGKATVNVTSNGKVLYSKKVTIDTVKPDDATIDFDINFNNDFDAAVTEFKKIFYIRQEKRAGTLSGGENGHLIYFDRGEKCATWENHGDFYDGAICCNEKDSGQNRWYGGVANQIQFPLNEDKNVVWYTDKHIPDPLKVRTQRVGSLVQSKKYYGYGEFEIEMKIPTDFKGEAICWWMFHYQELYYPLDEERYKFYAGGCDTNTTKGDDKAVYEYRVGEKKGAWNYLHSFKQDSGMPYIIVNNEIDLELGSEITQIVFDKNPNENPSYHFYTPLLDPRTVVGCSKEGADYGMWLLDWEASKAVIENKMNAINSVGTEYLDRRNSPYLSTAANELKWIHVSNTICDRICYDASTKAIRWNNWLTEPDVGGGVEANTKYSNAIMAMKDVTHAIDGRSGWDMMNTVAATTPRTPLGEINLSAENIDDRFIPHEMDDGKYHTYRFCWHRDYTKCYIDGTLVRTNATCSPFIPMPFLIGGWFPSDNEWGDYAKSGYFGTWAGVKAAWDIRHFQIRRIKYRHYTEEESPRDQMLYHGESYPYSGLREIIEEITPTPEPQQCTITINTIPFDAIVIMNGRQTKSITVPINSNVTYSISREHYATKTGVILADETKVIDITLVEATKNNFTVLLNNVSKLTLSDGQIFTNSNFTEGVAFNIVSYNDELTYTAYKDGYKTKTGTLIKNKLTIITLLKYYVFSIIPTPSNAVVKINNMTTSSVNAVKGEVLSWNVSSPGYITRTGTYIMKAADSVNNIELKTEESVYGETTEKDVQRIANILNANDKNTVVFIQESDIHSQLCTDGTLSPVGDEYIKRGVKAAESLINKIKDKVTVLGIFNTGDIVDRANVENGTPAALIKNLVELKSWHVNSDTYDFAYTPGNHDVLTWENKGGSTNGLADSAKAFDEIQSPDYIAKYPQTANTYKVYPDVRIIVAMYDFYDYKAHPDTAINGYWKTMTDDILNIIKTNPTYKVVIFAHQPPTVTATSFLQDKWTMVDSTYKASVSVMKYSAYVYEKLGDYIIASIHGHKHSDILSITKGFPIIQNVVMGQLLINDGTRSPYYDEVRLKGYTTDNGELDTIAQCTINVYAYNKTTNMLHCYRIGPGPDVDIQLSEGYASVQNFGVVETTLEEEGLSTGKACYKVVASPMFTAETDPSFIKPNKVSSDAYKFVVNLAKYNNKYYSWFVPIGWRYFIVGYNLDHGTWGNAIDFEISQLHEAITVASNTANEGPGPKVLKGTLSSNNITYGDSITLNVTNFTNIPTVNVTDTNGNTVNVELMSTSNTETIYSFYYQIKCYNVKLRFTITSGTKTATVETDTIKDVTFNASFDKTSVNIDESVMLTVTGTRHNESDAIITYDSNYFQSHVIKDDLINYTCVFGAIKAGTSIISYESNNGRISQEITIIPAPPKEYVLSSEHNNAVFTVFNNYASVILTKYGVNVASGLTAEDCSKIASLMLNDNTSIFKDNTNITSFDEFKYFTGILNYKNIHKIETEMFYHCENLELITIPENVVDIDAKVFETCSKLATITFLGNVPETSSQTFGRYKKAGASVTGSKIIKVPSQYIDNYNNALMPDGVTTNYIKTIAVDELGYVIQAITE